MDLNPVPSVDRLDKFVLVKAVHWLRHLQSVNLKNIFAAEQRDIMMNFLNIEKLASAWWIWHRILDTSKLLLIEINHCIPSYSFVASCRNRYSHHSYHYAYQWAFIFIYISEHSCRNILCCCQGWCLSTWNGSNLCMCINCASQTRTRHCYDLKG